MVSYILETQTFSGIPLKRRLEADTYWLIDNVTARDEKVNWILKKLILRMTITVQLNLQVDLVIQELFNCYLIVKMLILQLIIIMLS